MTFNPRIKRCEFLIKCLGIRDAKQLSNVAGDSMKQFLIKTRYSEFLKGFSLKAIYQVCRALS